MSTNPSINLICKKDLREKHIRPFSSLESFHNKNIINFSLFDNLIDSFLLNYKKKYVINYGRSESQNKFGI